VVVRARGYRRRWTVGCVGQVKQDGLSADMATAIDRRLMHTERYTHLGDMLPLIEAMPVMG
jgi:hypothetical protein